MVIFRSKEFANTDVSECSMKYVNQICCDFAICVCYDTIHMLYYERRYVDKEDCGIKAPRRVLFFA